MSHTSAYKVNFTDSECVKAALLKMGFREGQIEVHDERVHLNSYNGGRMNHKANVVIRRNNFSGMVNDFGVAVGEEDSMVFIDGNQLNVSQLEQYYGVEKTLKESQLRGYFTSQEVMEDGRIRLRLRR